MKTNLKWDVLFIWICFGSFISWENLLEDVSESNFNSSVVSLSLDHQTEDLGLKSPVITDKDGLLLLMPFKKFSKLDRNESKDRNRKVESQNHQYFGLENNK